MSEQESKQPDDAQPNDDATQPSVDPDAAAASLPDAAHHDAPANEAQHDTAHDHDPHHDEAHHDYAHHPNRVRFDTTCGEIIVELWDKVAPRTVDHFAQLVHTGFYDGLSFHRVVPGFLVQTGCPKGDGTGGCGYTVAAEFNDSPHERGVVSMARRPNDADSASSQFFICLDRENCAHLDGQYTVFGKITKESMDTLDQLEHTPLSSPELGVPQDSPQILHCFEDWDDHHYAYDHDYHHGHDAPAPDEHAGEEASGGDPSDEKAGEG